MTRRVLKHLDMQTTQYYLDTMDDDLTEVMPSFVYEGELDKIGKTSNPKIVTLGKPAKTQAKRRTSTQKTTDNFGGSFTR